MITAAQRSDIAAAHAAGIPKLQIAKQLGITWNTVHRIIRELGRYDQRGASKGGYEAYYKWASIQLKAGLTVGEIAKMVAPVSPSPSVTTFRQWATNNRLVKSKGQGGRKKAVAPQKRVNVEKIDAITKKLAFRAMKYQPRFKWDKSWKEEIIAEMRLLSFEIHEQVGDIGVLPTSVLKLASARQGVLERLLGRTKVESAKKERIERQEFASFDYENHPDGPMLKRVLAAYSIFGWDGVENEVTFIAEPEKAHKILRDLFKK